MIEDAIEPRPAPGSLDRLIAASALLREALLRDPDSVARNWNDRESAWVNLRDLRHWIERARG